MARMHAEAGATDELQPWDWHFYDTRQSMEHHGVDQNEVTEYLPLDPVLDGMFALTGEVFGLDYERVPEANAWHPSVQLFRIKDRATGELIAHFYADLFPREGKFTHAAAFPLVIGHRAADGSYVKPVNAIVANFTPPSATPAEPADPRAARRGRDPLPRVRAHPAHEPDAGRVHPLLGRRDGVGLRGGAVPDHGALGLAARDPGPIRPPLPDRRAHSSDLVERMAGSRFINVGIRATRQVFFGTMDLALHATADEPDMDAAIRESWRVTQLPYPEDTFMLASFGHLMGGYDAGYYGYLWAEVIGDDMWGRFVSEGIDSPVVGAAYRRAVLEPNGSLSGDELVAGFLGRPASIESYLRMRGMGATADVAG